MKIISQPHEPGNEYSSGLPWPRCFGRFAVLKFAHLMQERCHRAAAVSRAGGGTAQDQLRPFQGPFSPQRPSPAPPAPWRRGTASGARAGCGSDRRARRHGTAPLGAPPAFPPLPPGTPRHFTGGGCFLPLTAGCGPSSPARRTTSPGSLCAVATGLHLPAERR